MSETREMSDTAFANHTAFDGPIGDEYTMLRLICPAAADMSRQVGAFVRGWQRPDAVNQTEPLEVLEIGCGTGITSCALLDARNDLVITAVDIAPAMLAQARVNLAGALGRGRIRLVENDALDFLRGLESDSVDLVASGYALHNFEQSYRQQAVREVLRVLKPGGVLVNGDRYALDDTLEHLNVVQDEVRQFFKVFRELDRLNLLEQWIVHLYSDESPDHVMRLGAALADYQSAGFDPVTVHDRHQNNALVSAQKPVS